MTLFDLIAIGVIGVSAFIGYGRGAVRELVGLFAFTLSAAAALFLLPFTGKLAARLIHTPLAATALAIIGGFAVVYLGLKVIGHLLATHIHQQTVFGSADRVAGFGIGAVRALILLGLFALVFDKATPEALKPRWIAGGFLYPLASASGRMIGAVAPAGLHVAGDLGPILKGAVGQDSQPASEDDAVQPKSTRPPTNDLVNPPSGAHKGRAGGKGYDTRARDSLDQLVERTR